MKYAELLNRTEDELRKELVALRDKVDDLRVKTKLGQIKNMHELSLAKKDIARILTALRAKM